LHGKGKFQKRELELEDVDEAKKLLIPLVSAERCWAHAEERKQNAEATQKTSATMKHHCARRLNRAAQWAQKLSALTKKVGDARTSLEAEAYASYMKGNLLVHLRGKWKPALLNLMRSKVIYEGLARAAETAESQIVFKQQIEEIEPIVRFCSYNLQGAGEDSNGTSDTSVLFQDDVEVLELLESMRDATASGAFHPVQQLEWWGSHVPVYGTALQIEIGRVTCLWEANESLVQMDADATRKHFAGLFAALTEAKNMVESDIRNSFDDRDEQRKHNLEMLRKILQGMLFETSIQKSEQDVAMLGNEFADEGTRSKRHAKLELIKAKHEEAIKSISDLAELGTGKMGEEDNELLLQYCMAQLAYTRGSKSYYIGKLYENAKQPLEAYALFDRTLEYIEEARSRCTLPDTKTSNFTLKVKYLESLATRSKLSAHAQWARKEEAKDLEMESKLRDVSLNAAEAGPELKTVAGNLAEFLSPDGGKATSITHFPPRMQTVPIGPIFLDAAMEEIEVPDLSHRFKRAQSSSRLGRLFGW